MWLSAGLFTTDGPATTDKSGLLLGRAGTVEIAADSKTGSRLLASKYIDVEIRPMPTPVMGQQGQQSNTW